MFDRTLVFFILLRTALFKFNYLIVILITLEGLIVGLFLVLFLWWRLKMVFLYLFLTSSGILVLRILIFLKIVSFRGRVKTGSFV